MVLSRLKNETHSLTGTPLPQKPAWDKTSHTIIARTNAKLFDRAVTLIKNAKIGFSGGISGARLERLKDVYHLFARERSKVYDPFIKGFEDYGALLTYARAVEDFEVLAQCGMVDKYRSRLPALVDRVMEKAVDENQADILLTTAHKAKGMEWPFVLLMDDFTPLIKDGLPIDPGTVAQDEINLIYVAMTRAKTHLRFTKESDIPEFIRYCLKKGKKG